MKVAIKITSKAKNNRFFEEFKPILVLGAIFGAHALRRNTFSNKLEFRYISWATLYFVLVNLVQLSITTRYILIGIEVIILFVVKCE